MKTSAHIYIYISFSHNTYISVQSHISGVDHSCYIIDAEHGLVDAERWKALLSCYGVAQHCIVCVGVVSICC